MGYYSNLGIEIEEALFQGATPEQIANRFDLTVEDVKGYIEMLAEADRDPQPVDQ